MMPDRIGMVSGLFFGLAFCMGGLGAAGLGALADRIRIVAICQICAPLPLLGWSRLPCRVGRITAERG